MSCQFVLQISVLGTEGIRFTDSPNPSFTISIETRATDTSGTIVTGGVRYLSVKKNAGATTEVGGGFSRHLLQQEEVVLMTLSSNGTASFRDVSVKFLHLYFSRHSCNQAGNQLCTSSLNVCRWLPAPCAIATVAISPARSATSGPWPAR